MPVKDGRGARLAQRRAVRWAVVVAICVVDAGSGGARGGPSERRAVGSSERRREKGDEADSVIRHVVAKRNLLFASQAFRGGDCVSDALAPAILRRGTFAAWPLTCA